MDGYFITQSEKSIKRYEKEIKAIAYRYAYPCNRVYYLTSTVHASEKQYWTDASSRMSADQIADVALSLEYVKQYGASHKGSNHKQLYLLEQCVVWQRLNVHLGWQCDNVRASYDEISKAI